MAYGIPISLGTRFCLHMPPLVGRPSPRQVVGRHPASIERRGHRRQPAGRLAAKISPVPSADVQNHRGTVRPLLDVNLLLGAPPISLERLYYYL